MSAHASFDPQQNPHGGWGVLSPPRARNCTSQKKKIVPVWITKILPSDVWLFFFLISLTSRSEQIRLSQHTANDATTNVFDSHLEAATHLVMYLFIFRGKQRLSAAPALLLYLGQNKAISSGPHALSQLFYSDTLSSVVPYGRNRSSL